MNLDSLNNGFKLAELDSTYMITYVADSINQFKKEIDTTIIFNSSNIFNNHPFNMDEKELYVLKENLLIGNYNLKKSFKILNSNSKIVTEISNIKVELYRNEKKCCTEYIDDKIKSFDLNGVKQLGEKVVEINKQ